MKKEERRITTLDSFPFPPFPLNSHIISFPYKRDTVVGDNSSSSSFDTRGAGVS
jgi:hypothetical protein